MSLKRLLNAIGVAGLLWVWVTLLAVIIVLILQSSQAQAHHPRGDNICHVENQSPSDCDISVIVDETGHNLEQYPVPGHIRALVVDGIKQPHQRSCHTPGEVARHSASAHLIYFCSPRGYWSQIITDPEIAEIVFDRLDIDDAAITTEP